MKKFLSGLEQCIEIGMKKLNFSTNKEADFDDFEVKVWQQIWGDTSTGFGGGGFQVITTAYTVVILNKEWSECVVFHNMRYAYTTEITKEIAKGIQAQRLPGKQEVIK